MEIPKELRESGLKATLPRLHILRLFQEGKNKHLSAEDVLHYMLAENIDVGLGTIYRVLVQFVDAGILIRHQFEFGPAVFELNAGCHHDHLICTVCGKVEEFIDRDIERRQHEIATQRQFVLQEHALSLYGICATCEENKKSARLRASKHFL